MNKVKVLGGTLTIIGGGMSLIAFNTISWGLNDGTGVLTIYHLLDLCLIT